MTRKAEDYIPALKAGAVIITDDIDDSAVTAAKVADGAVTIDKISDATLTNAKVAVPKDVIYQEAFVLADMTDGGSAIATFDLTHSIPAGSVFVRSTIHALTGFAGDTTATIQIGDGSDADRYTTGTPSVFTTAAAGVDLGGPAGTAWHDAAKTPKVTITAGSEWGDVTGGAVTVTLFYQRPV